LLHQLLPLLLKLPLQQLLAPLQPPWVPLQPLWALHLPPWAQHLLPSNLFKSIKKPPKGGFFMGEPFQVDSR
jgi:hypothetical protein